MTGIFQCKTIDHNSNRLPEFQVRPLDSLHLPKRQNKKHSKKQIQKIAGSIEEFSFLNPILIHLDGNIICGAARYLAAKELKLKSVPVLIIDYLDEAQIKAYRIAENKLGELSEWDTEVLKLEFDSLLVMDFDLELTGFETHEIDPILLGDCEISPQEEAPPEPPENPISREGDLWLLGKHRLYCGNALEAKSYKILMAGQKAQMIFSDPPYNVKIDKNVCGKGRIKHAEFAMASGEMTTSEFTTFLTRSFDLMAANSIDGSIHYLCMDWRHMQEMLLAGATSYSELKNLCIWVKNNGGMGSFYRSQHELVFVYKKGSAPHINNFDLGQHGRNRTNVWEYAGINSFKPDRMKELALHPTVKPIEMVKDAILDCSNPGGVILDAFMGGGTTLMAAEATGRVAYGLEIDPRYMDVILKRFADTADIEPTLSDGRSLSQTSYDRMNDEYQENSNE